MQVAQLDTFGFLLSGFLCENCVLYCPVCSNRSDKDPDNYFHNLPFKNNELTGGRTNFLGMHVLWQKEN